MQPSNFIIPGRLKTVIGDVSMPVAAGHRIIVNFCSNNGDWRKESDSISKRWNKIQQEFTRWYRSQVKFMLGEIQEINVQSDTTIVNMLVYNNSELDNDALLKCVDKVGELAKNNGSSVHVNITNEDNFETCLTEKVIKRGINVTLYNKKG